MRHLATARDGSLVCLHAGFRFWLTTDGIERSATSAEITEAAEVEGGWIFTSNESASSATTPVAPLRDLGAFPRYPYLWQRPPPPSGQYGALVRARDGRVFEADADGVREIELPFPVHDALAYGEHRVLRTPAGVVVHGRWDALRTVPLEDSVRIVRLDAHGPVLSTLQGERRRVDGRRVDAPARRRSQPSTHPQLRHLEVLAHASSPFRGVVRRRDGAAAAVRSGRLLIRSRDGSVRAHDTTGDQVIAGVDGGWLLHRRGTLHVAEDGNVLRNWPRLSLRGVRGWWGSCEGSGEREPDARPAEACVLDSAARPRPVRLFGETFAQCGDRVYERVDDRVVVHDLVRGRFEEARYHVVSGTCGPNDRWVFFGQRGGRRWLADASGELLRETPFEEGWLLGMSDDGEIVARVRPEGHWGVEIVAHSLDAGRTWHQVDLGTQTDCTARGCFTDSPDGYVAVASLPTLPLPVIWSDRPTYDRDAYLDDWNRAAPFAVECEPSTTGARAALRLRAGNRMEVREASGASWEVALDPSIVRLWPLAVAPNLVVLRAGCRVFRVSPEGSVELPRPIDHYLGCFAERRGEARPDAVIERDGNVVVSWAGSCVVGVRRFDARGRVLSTRRLDTREPTTWSLTTRGEHIYLARFNGPPPYELVPLSPGELPARLDLPPLRRWSPRVCRENEPAGFDFRALNLPPHGSVRLRLGDDGDVCVLGSTGDNGFVARSGRLVRGVKNRGRSVEDECEIRAANRDFSNETP